MTVALLPPVSSSGMEWRGELPLTEAPRYLRGPGNSRWHRARSGEVWPDGRTIINYWCGPSHQWRSEHEVWQRDDIPNDDAMCGT